MTRRPFTIDDPAYVAFWRERHLCTVTTIRADGSLHATPMGVVLDPEGGYAWAITSGGSVKARNIRAFGEAGAQISVCAVDGRWWASLDGIAHVHDDEATVEEACRRYAERYRVPRPNPERVALRITVNRTLGNLDLGLDLGAEAPR